jgi:hypothetical protein
MDGYIKDAIFAIIMPNNLAKLIPVCPELEKIAPNNVNHPLLLEVVDQITDEAQSVLPSKRSGFIIEAMLYANIYGQISHLSPKNATKDLRKMWKGYEHHFQRFNKHIFSNGKKRQALPDQPAMSRFLQRISESGVSEEFGNLLLWAQFLYLLKDGRIHDDLTLIADYHDEACQKDKTDSYCFGTKEGKTVHRTLAFSVISGSIHLIIATFKIKKTQHKLPLFEEIMTKIQKIGLNIKYALLDRGFYRKEILAAMKNWQITTILPGRTCTDTKQKIKLWIQDQSGRTGKLTLKLKYVKKRGWQRLMMDYVLVGKRGHALSEVKHDLRQGKITEADATKRVFPLLVIRGNSKGIKMVRGNEDYIRSLYRERWEIEIAFRQTHLIGRGNWYQNRDKRLFNFTIKCFIYNLWQIEREKIHQISTGMEPLTLDEFCGRMIENRTISPS